MRIKYYVRHEKDLLTLEEQAIGNKFAPFFFSFFLFLKKNAMYYYTTKRLGEIILKIIRNMSIERLQKVLVIAERSIPNIPF